MAVKIRLSRSGAKNKPFYRIVVADARSPRDGRFIDRVGTYDPMKSRDDQTRVSLNIERIAYWLEKGAQPTDRVLRFIDQAGVSKRPERINPKKAQPKQKAVERAKKKESKEQQDEAPGTQA